ncbi:MAG TPA: 3-oxoacyl-ACP synthase [bacterium]|nr:3-oxoacyl-ACP synthase [bacterium]HNW16525.1 3-oxoacyl-ACP synthase [bacterium]HPY13488.1 3-oxoacyl-ACP synthase [bacterium]HQN73660.1 3-oxoacyl-ACP synthase [bacterium]HQO91683.1 3-oxoacyl-ACP synthase [bacterium]
MRLKIIRSCRISNDTVEVDGKTVLKTTETPGTSKQFKEIYLSLNIDYPKFYKMDMLSKLAFLAVEFIKNEGFSEKDTAIIMTNANSTLDVDLKYTKSIDPDNYFPNPAFFVYTLPNVMIGEISIRHNLKGESVFVSTENKDLELLENIAKTLEFKNCIAGFIEYENENNFEADIIFLKETI